MLALETAFPRGLLLSYVLAGPPVSGPEDWHGESSPAPSPPLAMGAQSVVVRLLMRGIPQTNVMTGNMTQLGIETTGAYPLLAQASGAPAGSRLTCTIFSPCGRGSPVVLSITIGFILGA